MCIRDSTDTVYVYNNAQLQAIAAEDAEDKPIMSKDMIASEFGKGGLVYADGSTTDIIGETGFRYEDADIIVDEEGDYLTYSSEPVSYTHLDVYKRQGGCV